MTCNILFQAFQFFQVFGTPLASHPSHPFTKRGQEWMENMETHRNFESAAQCCLALGSSFASLRHVNAEGHRAQHFQNSVATTQRQAAADPLGAKLWALPHLHVALLR